jgi:ankyrin repeat protein
MDYALHRAAAEGCIETAEQLVNAGAELEERDRRGYTPLIEAAWGGKMEMMTWLVEKGAD